MSGCDTVLAQNNGNKAYDVIKWYLGIPGTENVIAYRLNKFYRLKNPCKMIHCIHMHKSTIRPRYSHRISGERRRWGTLQKVPISGL